MLRLQAPCDGPQQPIAHRMTEGVVDVLEQVEIDAHDSDVLAGRSAPPQRLLETLLVKLAVRQIGQAVMMGHMGDAGFGLPALGDVDDRDQKPVMAVERDTTPIGQHLDLAAVGLEMATVLMEVIGIVEPQQRVVEIDPFVPKATNPQIVIFRNCARL